MSLYLSTVKCHLCSPLPSHPPSKCPVSWPLLLSPVSVLLCRFWWQQRWHNQSEVPTRHWSSRTYFDAWTTSLVQHTTPAQSLLPCGWITWKLQLIQIYILGNLHFYPYKETRDSLILKLMLTLKLNRAYIDAGLQIWIMYFLGVECHAILVLFKPQRSIRGKVIRIFQRPRFAFLKACEQNEIGCLQFTCLQSHHEKPVRSQLLDLKPLWRKPGVLANDGVALVSLVHS